jgi:integrase
LKFSKNALLADPDIRRWFDNLARGSEATGDVWLRRLRAFCVQTKTTPRDLVRLKPRPLRDLFMDFISSEERRGSSGPYIAHSVAVAKSWLRFNDVTVPSGLKIRGADKVREETALSPEQVRAILNVATPRERVAIALMSQAGVRPEVLGDYKGMDGMRLRDFPELILNESGIKFEKTPALIVVRPELSKARHKYLTWIGAEAANLLVDYLESRRRTGERLAPDSSLLRAEHSQKPFIRTLKIGEAIRHAFRAAGFEGIRPYVLRTTFATRMLECENAGKVTHAYWTFWFGHKGEMSAVYTTNRGKLASSTIEQMRESYRRCEPALTGSTPNEAEVRREVSKIILESLGYSKADIDSVDLGNVDQVRALTQKRMAPSPGKQALVSVDELPGYLEDGWTFVGNVGQDRILLSPPVGEAGGATNRPSPQARPSEGNPALPRSAGGQGPPSGASRPPA